MHFYKSENRDKIKLRKSGPKECPGSGRSPGEGIGYPLQYSWASLVAQLVKNPPVMWEAWVWSLSWEDPLEKGKATHSSILAWKIPWACIVHGIAKNQTWLSDFHFYFQGVCKFGWDEGSRLHPGRGRGMVSSFWAPTLDWLVEVLTKRVQGWCIVAGCICLTFDKWQVHPVA